jgi:hypothetical protein
MIFGPVATLVADGAGNSMVLLAMIEFCGDKPSTKRLDQLLRGYVEEGRVKIKPFLVMLQGFLGSLWANRNQPYTTLLHKARQSKDKLSKEQSKDIPDS